MTFFCRPLRRVLIGTVALAAVFALRPITGQAQQATAAIAPVRTINHLQFRVTDPRKSFEFYMKLFGGHLIDTSPNGWTMMLADTKEWISFGKIPAGSTAKPGTLDHAGIGIDLPKDPDRLREALKAAFPSGKVQSPGTPGDLTYNRSIYVSDPDGFSLQLISRTDDGHLPRADTTPAAPRTPAKGFVRFRGLNHLSLTVVSRETSRDFYARLLGNRTHFRPAVLQFTISSLPRVVAYHGFCVASRALRAKSSRCPPLPSRLIHGHSR